MLKLDVEGCLTLAANRATQQPKSFPICTLRLNHLTNNVCYLDCLPKVYQVCRFFKREVVRTSMPIKSSGRIVPPGWAPLQPKQSVLSLIV